MKMLSVRLDDREEAVLQALCDESGLSRSEVVKRGISTLAAGARRKSPGALAEELGIVGAFSGPRDLSARTSHYVKKALRAKSAR
jgi:Arc/MetJ-type ribon-helix-helix transcriptional regulator